MATIALVTLGISPQLGNVTPRDTAGWPSGQGRSAEAGI